MDKKDTDVGKHVSIQLFQHPSVFKWLAFEAHASVEECCGLLHHVPLPKWLINWESDWGCDCSPANTPPLNDDGCDCWSKFGDYYGDTWGDLWHIYIECTLMSWAYSDVEKDVQYVNTSLDEFPDDFSEVSWIRNEIEREKKYAKEHGGIVNPLDLPCIDYGGSSWLYKFLEWATRRWRTPLCDGTGPENKH